MLSKTLTFLMMTALPLMAQTPPANQTMGTNPTTTTSKTTTKATKATKTEVKTETKTEEKHETKAEEKAEHKAPKHKAHHGMTGHSGAYEYSTRLASLLADTQDKAMLSPTSWKAVANEADALSNKLYASTTGKWRTEAKEARTHVREMHAAAMKGDADGAKSHAGMALPYVYKIIEATTPKKM